ncbi:TetR/AcrR family transcriptional regulator [Thermodesulfobacteriota bacterium]
MSVSRKQQIARAAMEIISEEGMSKLVMARIAERIGVTDAALYKHFKSKNDMLLYMIEELEQSMIDKFIAHVGQIEDPVERLYNLLRFQFEFIEQNRGIPRIIFSESLQKANQEIRAKIEGLLTNYLETIKAILISARADGRINGETNIDAAAAIFIGMIQSTVIFWTLSDFSYSLKEKQDSLWKEYRKIIR